MAYKDARDNRHNASMAKMVKKAFGSPSLMKKMESKKAVTDVSKITEGKYIRKSEAAIKAGDVKGAKQAIKDSDMKGKVKRKVTRAAAEEARTAKRSNKKAEKAKAKQVAKSNKQANKSTKDTDSYGSKAKTSKDEKKARKTKAKQMKADAKYYKKTGIDLSKA